MKTSELKVGQAVIFTKIPPLSCLTTHTIFEVNYVGKKSIGFTNVLTDAQTIEKIQMMRFSEFKAS